MQKKINNIILDLGVVILNIDPELSVQAFRDLGFKGFEKHYTLQGQSNLFDLLETGKISPADFRKEIREEYSKDLSDEQIDKAWNALLLDFPANRIDLLEKLSEKYNLYLLSNTNAIHFEKYMQDFREQYGKEFSSFFKKLFVSHELGFRKPDANIYKKVLAEMNSDGADCIFIDDNKQNVEASCENNLPAYWLKSGEDLVDLFPEISCDAILDRMCVKA